METIDFERLQRELPELRSRFLSAVPFHYIVIENLLNESAANRILAEFPPIDRTWVNANGLHTRNKWTNPAVAGSIAEAFYREVNSAEFLKLISSITGIDHLEPDGNLQGAGYHQILDGGFLDVHVDFNKLDSSGLDRRLNLLVYLNRDWDPEYGAALELWDMSSGQRRIESIPPTFNRCVMFETNEVSFHGHPVPLKTGSRTTRKSLSVYYYTAGRDDVGDVAKHSTIYVNTEGARGTAKTFLNVVRDLATLGWVKRRLKRPTRP